MTIQSISRTNFNKRLSSHSILEEFIGEETEWFVDATGDLIGTVALGRRCGGWNFVIFRRNMKNEFHVCCFSSDFVNLQAARVDFMFAMGAADKDGAEIR
jgi:hypothetical protein